MKVAMVKVKQQAEQQGHQGHDQQPQEAQPTDLPAQVHHHHRSSRLPPGRLGHCCYVAGLGPSALDTPRSAVVLLAMGLGEKNDTSS